MRIFQFKHFFCIGICFDVNFLHFSSSISETRKTNIYSILRFEKKAPKRTFYDLSIMCLREYRMSKKKITIFGGIHYFGDLHITSKKTIIQLLIIFGKSYLNMKFSEIIISHSLDINQN